EGGVFAGALDFDKGVVGEHGDVHIDFGFNIFEVVEVGDDGGFVGAGGGDDADADGGDLIDEGLGFGREEAFGAGGGDGIGDGDPGAGDGGGARAAVGLEDVAVNEKREAGSGRARKGGGFEFGKVETGAQRAAYEALNFDGAAVGFGGVAAFASG